MDFGVLPPEVNSGRMYAGPGSGPMLAAAAAWARLATELASAARAYESVIAGLTGEAWSGPAAESMAAAAGPYTAWLGATAVGAERAAAQATAAASAFDQAHAAVVPPPVIAANRARLAALVAANVFGQNTAAIAATEAQYGEMWVQDAAVMYGYAGRSAVAAAVTPFGEPPSTTSPAGLAGQAGAVVSAAGGAHSQLSQLIGAIPQALHGLAPSTGSPVSLGGTLEPLQSTTSPSLSQLAAYVETTARSILPANDTNISTLYGMLQYARNLNTDLDIAAATGGRAGFGSGIPALTSVESAGPVGARSVVSASTGNASVVGKLAVPPTWVETTPEVTMTAAAPPDATSAASAVAPAAPGEVFADMALAGLAGRAIGGRFARGRPAGYAPDRIERLAAELAGTGEVQHWHTDPSRRKSLLTELLEQPGVHEVYFNHDGQTPPEPGPQQS